MRRVKPSSGILFHFPAPCAAVAGKIAAPKPSVASDARSLMPSTSAFGESLIPWVARSLSRMSLNGTPLGFNRSGNSARTAGVTESYLERGCELGATRTGSSSNNGSASISG